MADFATLDAVEARIKAQMAAGVWVVGHSELSPTGQPRARFMRHLNAAVGITEDSMTEAGAWDVTTSDTAD